MRELKVMGKIVVRFVSLSIMLFIISCRTQETVNWKKLVASTKSITVFNVPVIDISGIDTFDMPNIMQMKLDNFDLEIFKKIFVNVKYKKGIPIWKTGRLTIINLENNDRLYIAISVYGSFFRMKGVKGYFYFDGLDGEIFSKEFERIIWSKK